MNLEQIRRQVQIDRALAQVRALATAERLGVARAPFVIAVIDAIGEISIEEALLAIRRFAAAGIEDGPDV